MHDWKQLPKCCKKRASWMMVHCVYLNEYTPCFSGLNAYITVGRYGYIRVDMMDDMEPVISFSGQEVQKIINSMEYWFAKEMIEMSASHWMYVGIELQRASVLGVAYEQG